MGIRINVSMGWGFRHSRHYNDPRLTSEFAKLWRNGERDLLPKYKKAVKAVEDSQSDEWHKDKMDSTLLLQKLEGRGWYENKKKLETLSVHDIIHTCGYDGEGDLINAPMVFVPVEHEDWYRHDDIIDYYTAPTYADRGPKNTLKMICDEKGYPSPIYPYAIYVNRKTGDMVKNGSEFTWYRRLCLDKQLMSGPKQPFAREDSEYVKQLKDAGITTPIQLQRDLVPEVPFSIRIFCETFNVFRDPMTVHRLKPMIYYYWD